jgi:5-(carboxyamino)imidazole ribonucleotide mutase
MGSSSDADIMRPAADILTAFGVEHDFKVVSAHRTPQQMYEFAADVDNNSVQVIIAGAGGAAHLPGMIAALTTVPVIGVPIQNGNSLMGLDALLSIVQMPKDVPVATVAINNSHNAAILAVEILAVSNPDLKVRLRTLKQDNINKVTLQNELLNKNK